MCEADSKLGPAHARSLRHDHFRLVDIAEILHQRRPGRVQAFQKLVFRSHPHIVGQQDIPGQDAQFGGLHAGQMPGLVKQDRGIFLRQFRVLPDTVDVHAKSAGDAVDGLDLLDAGQPHLKQGIVQHGRAPFTSMIDSLEKPPDHAQRIERRATAPDEAADQHDEQDQRHGRTDVHKPARIAEKRLV